MRRNTLIFVIPFIIFYSVVGVGFAYLIMLCCIHTYMYIYICIYDRHSILWINTIHLKKYSNLEPDFSLANILSNVSVEKPFCNSNSFLFKFKTTDINSIMPFPDPGVSTCRGLSESPLQADSLAKVPHHLSSCSYICFSLPPLLDLLD